MGYDKGSFESFKVSLQKDGKYATATGARRAIGKLAQLSDSERDTARKLVDKHFGETSAAPAAKAPKGKVGRPAGTTKVKTAAATPATKERKPMTRTPRAGKEETHSPLELLKTGSHESYGDLGIGERVVTSATQALAALENVKEKFDIDTTSAAQAYTSTLSDAVGIFRRVVTSCIGASPQQFAPKAAEAESEGEEPASANSGGLPYFPELQA